MINLTTVLKNLKKPLSSKKKVRKGLSKLGNSLKKAKQEYLAVQRANLESNGSLELFIYELANPYLSLKKEGKGNASIGYNKKISERLKDWTLRGKRKRGKKEYLARKAVVLNDYQSFSQILCKKGIRDNKKIRDLFKKNKERIAKIIEEDLSERAKREFGVLYASIRQSNSFEDYLKLNYFERAKRMNRLKDLGERLMTRHGEFSKNYLKSLGVKFDLRKVA